jgi:hypothetical protein
MFSPLFTRETPEALTELTPTLSVTSTVTVIESPVSGAVLLKMTELITGASLSGVVAV